MIAVRCTHCEECSGHDVYAFFEESVEYKFFDERVKDRGILAAKDPAELTAALIEEIRRHDRYHEVEAEGDLAFADGEESDKNPHSYNSPDYKAWERGYNDAALRAQNDARSDEIRRLEAEMYALVQANEAHRLVLASVGEDFEATARLCHEMAALLSVESCARALLDRASKHSIDMDTLSTALGALDQIRGSDYERQGGKK